MENYIARFTAVVTLLVFFFLNRFVFLNIEESLKYFNINILVGIYDILACGGKVSCLFRIPSYQVLCPLRYKQISYF